jgi:hypothetical protein
MGLLRPLVWLKNFLRDLFLGGENQIAIEIEGREAISREGWAALPEEERGKWEPASIDPRFYKRKP